MDKSKNNRNYYDLFGLTLGQILQKVSSEFPDKEALIFENTRVNYRDFFMKSQNIALALIKSGIKKGDRVAILLPNGLDIVYAQFGVLLAGGVFLLIDTRYRKSEIKYMLKHSEAKFLILVDHYIKTDFLEILKELKADLPNLERCIINGNMLSEDDINWQEFINLGDKLDTSILKRNSPKPDDLASILYTSGSTGTPKGVMTTHNAYVWGFSRTNERLHINSGDVFLQMLPSSHMFGFLVQISSIMGRCTNVIMENFNAEEALKLQEKEKVSVLYGVPSMFDMMLSSPNIAYYNLSSNRTGYISGGDCREDLVKSIINEMHCSISQAYGLSEAGPLTVSDYLSDAETKIKTAGPPHRDVDLKIVDEKRQEVFPGVVGEIAVRGENLFSGYYKQPELTKASFDSEGFFYTGDLGKLDPSNNLIVVGRQKEMIIRGGFNVYPEEVEAQISLINGVENVAVFGVPDRKLGEKICACIIQKPNYDISSEKIIASCKENLANYKVPDVIEISEEFPMTITGKIQKSKVKELILKKYSQ